MTSPAEILSYGVSGFGFLLAGFSYKLLSQEQRKDKPSPGILKTIVFFMVFSVILCLIGVLSELSSDDSVVNSRKIEWTIQGTVVGKEGMRFDGDVIKIIPKEVDASVTSHGSFTIKIDIPEGKRFSDVVHKVSIEHVEDGRYLVGEIYPGEEWNAYTEPSGAAGKKSLVKTSKENFIEYSPVKLEPMTAFE